MSFVSSSSSSSQPSVPPPPSLVSLFILHRGLSCHDETASDDEHYEKVLFFYPSKTPMTRQLQQVGFCEGLLDFVGRFGEDDDDEDDTIEVMRFKDRTYGFHRCEPHVYLVVVLREPGPTEAGAGRSDRALLSLLRLMYDSYELFYGQISPPLQQPQGREVLERIRVVRKQLRKNHQRRSMIEGGYEDEDHGGDEGEDSQEKPSVPSRKEKLSGLAESDKALNEELDTLLPKAPTTTIRSQLREFLMMYVVGTDFDNIHIFEYFRGFHILPPDLQVFRKVQALQFILTERFSPQGVLGCTFLYDGHVVWQGGLSQKELHLVYHYLQVRELAAYVHNQSTVQCTPSPRGGIPKRPQPASSTSRPPSPMSVSALVDQASRKTSIMDRLSTAFRMKPFPIPSSLSSTASGGGDQQGSGGGSTGGGEAMNKDDISSGTNTTSTTSSGLSGNGFLAVDGAHFLTFSSTKGDSLPATGPNRIWLPKIHTQSADQAQGQDKLTVILVLEEEVLPFMTEGDNEETHNDDGQTRTLHIETLRDICTEVSTSLAPELASLLVPSVMERAKLAPSSLPASLDGTRFIYYNHTNRCLLSSHSSHSINGIQNWPPLSVLYLKHKNSILNPVVLGVLDDYSSHIDGPRWGATDYPGHTGKASGDQSLSPPPYREVYMRTRSDGWVVCRAACNREVYVILDSKHTSIFDAQEALSKVLATCFGNILIA